MNVQEKLNEFKSLIHEGTHTKEEWLRIESNLEHFISENHLTQDDLKDFIASHSGEMLHMICSAYRSDMM